MVMVLECVVWLADSTNFMPCSCARLGRGRLGRQRQMADWHNGGSDRREGEDEKAL